MRAASRCASVTVPPIAASRYAASAVAVRAARARSRSPGGRGDSSSTAAVPATEASHQPASREPIVLAAAGEATGRM